MKTEMKRSHLIQRLTKPAGYLNPFSFGGGLKNGGIDKTAYDELNKVFSFDYMGAAEFEFGAVPKTLRNILKENKKFTSGSIEVDWKTEDWRTREVSEGKGIVYYLCRKSQEEEIKSRMKKWAKGDFSDHSPKCSVCLDSSFKDHNLAGWLELDNDFFFFIDKEMFDNIQQLFEIK